MASLSAVSVSKEYPGGVTALDGVNLTVAEGETLALVGASGSGKSTLLQLFNATVRPSHGEVRVDGEPLHRLDPITLRRRAGYVPQEGGLLPHWHVERNVALTLELQGQPRERRRQRAHETLRLVGLEPQEFGTRYPHQLSGGQRQRVALARALVAKPSYILLDEPFSALDPLTRHELHGEFLNLRRSLPTTTLLVTHDLAEAASLADRIAVMEAGRIQQLGTYPELLSQPSTEYVSRLLEAADHRALP